MKTTKELKEKLDTLKSKDAMIGMIWMWIKQDVVDLPTFKELLSYCETLYLDNDKIIQLTKEEVNIFMSDVSAGTGVWSDTSYKICRFIGINPTDGI